MLQRVFTVCNKFSLDWLCVARLTRLVIIEILNCALQLFHTTHIVSYFNAALVVECLMRCLRVNKLFSSSFLKKGQ